jgi:hypothetical protein
VAIHPRNRWHWKIPNAVIELHVESGVPRDLRVTFADERPINAKTSASGWTVSLAPEDAGRVLRFENAGRGELWFRLGNVSAEQAWVTTTTELVDSLPAAPPVDAPREDAIDEQFTPGRFGKAVVVKPGVSFTLPDHQAADGAVKKFFDTRQGTLEFWIKTLWDQRLRPAANMRYIGNGLVEAHVPWKLPYRAWAHVALVWRPVKSDPEKVILHVYVDGHDHAFYRSTNWEGYSQPPSLPRNGKWLQHFLATAAPGTAFALDEFRVSSSPRYAELDIEFGGQQTVNPLRFTPPDKPLQPDDTTMLLFHFDGDLTSDPATGQPPLQGALQTK